MKNKRLQNGCGGHVLQGSLGLCILAGIWICPVSRGAEESGKTVPAAETFYNGPALFDTRPSSQSELVQSVDRFGPVGIGIELHPPAFVMKVKNVEKGSPAEATGKLKAGQIIETINGQKLHDIDPRIQLGNIITEAEAHDGRVVLAVRTAPSAPLQDVTVTIPALGAYSKTWPLNCPKSDKIVRNLAARFAKDGYSYGLAMDGPKLLFLLSTGDEGDLALAREWVRKTVNSNQNFGDKGIYQWFIAWGAPPLAEYYLRTGDASVLPLLKKIADAAKKTQFHDAWGGRGMPGHHMGIAGTATLTYLLLARQCGVEVDEGMLQSALQHFYRFAGRGVNPYPDIRPESTFTDNGRCGILAYAMAAASSLVPEGEKSLYAKARDISATKSFYSTSYMLHGHTGGGIGEVWRSAAMGLLYEKMPSHYREFMEQRTWFYDLSRRYDGSFGVLGGAQYDTENFGITMGLTYTAPRKNLCIFGAPRSKYAKYHKLPEHPWGTSGDDAFLSLAAPVDKDGKVRNLDDERIVTDSGAPVDRKVSDPKVTDAELLQLIHHPEHRFREVAANAIYDLGRYNLIPDLLKDKDPRVRNAGVMAIRTPRVLHGEPIPGFPREKMTPEMVSLLFGMLDDPNEAWFTVDKVLSVIATFSADELGPHTERLLYFLAQDEWWLRHNALNVLAPLAADPRYYKQVLQGIETQVPKMVRAPTELRAVANRLKDAPPEVQKAGLETLGRLYLAYPGRKAIPPGGLHPSSEQWYLDAVAEAITALPGGLDKLYAVSRQRFPDNVLSHRESFLAGLESKQLSPDLNTALAVVIKKDLIPEFVAQNRKQLISEAAWDKSKRNGMFAVGVLGGSGMVPGLSDLYDQAGIKDYDWHTFGPKRTDVTWDYYSFDPKEQQSWESADSRYRKVTLPAGMEKWYEPGFDAQKAGWKTASAPFASREGKFQAQDSSCNLPYCGCGEPPKTFWEHEVLLMRGTFDLPPLDPTKRYRLLIGGRSHVGRGDGVAIYLNGTLVHEQEGGTGKREGNRPCGFFIDKDLAKKFGAGGKVQLAVKAFIGKQPRLKEKTGFITIHFEEMNIPPFASMMAESARAMPLLASAWQAVQFPDVEPDDPNEGKFRYDGKFVANPKVVGDWLVIDQVATMDAFAPDHAPAKLDKKRLPFSAVSLKENGETGENLLIWSGDKLLDLDRGQALAMTVRTLGDADYLFVEAGGFNAKNGPDWKSPLLVLKRAGKK